MSRRAFVPLLCAALLLSFPAPAKLLRHASQVVGMAESPSIALRRKRDSSLRVAAELVRDGKAAAFISAGNTGAAMAISMFVIGVLRGIDRPAIAAVLPNLRGYTVLLDVGANVAPKPWHLFQYALMGHVYARDILGADRHVALGKQVARRIENGFDIGA